MFFFFAKKAGAQPIIYSIHKEAVYAAVQRRHSSSSGTTTAGLQALVLLPAVTVYARVGGARQQQEIEPRQHEHV